LSALIQNGAVVTCEKSFPADLLIDGETIRETAPGIPRRAEAMPAEDG
jgi:hypothetical protein